MSNTYIKKNKSKKKSKKNLEKKECIICYKLNPTKKLCINCNYLYCVKCAKKLANICSICKKNNIPLRINFRTTNYRLIFINIISIFGYISIIFGLFIFLKFFFNFIFINYNSNLEIKILIFSIYLIYYFRNFI